MRYFIGLLTFFMLFPANVIADDDIEKFSITRIATMEKKGAKAYKKGDFKKAFELLTHPAQLGYKQSQYLLAFMFLKGQHVEQSVVLGMAWLGVAKESKIKSWQLLFDQIYAAATVEQQLKIDEKVAQYVEQFGVKTQQVSCVNRVPVGKKASKIECTKRPNRTSPIYPIELTETQ